MDDFGIRMRATGVGATALYPGTSNKHERSTRHGSLGLSLLASGMLLLTLIGWLPLARPAAAAIWTSMSALAAPFVPALPVLTAAI